MNLITSDEIAPRVDEMSNHCKIRIWSAPANKLYEQCRKSVNSQENREGGESTLAGTDSDGAYVCLMYYVCLLWEPTCCNNCHATVKKKDDWVILLMGYPARSCNCQWVTSMLMLVTNCFNRWIRVELILRRYSIYVKKFLSPQFQWALNTFSFDISNEYNVFTFSVCSIDWSV